MTATDMRAAAPTAEAVLAAPAIKGVTSTSRLTMIDIAKGLGILLIVFGHDGNIGIHFPELQETLRGIRMPFFFFLAGVTFSMGKRSLGQLALLRADAWLKPYVLTAIFFGLLNIYVHKISTYESVSLGVLFGTGFTVSPTAIWFLPHLWLLYMTAAAVLQHGKQLLEHPAARLVLLTLLLTAGSFFLDYFDSRTDNPARWAAKELDDEFFSFGLPFSADLLPITLAFFLMGNFLSSQAKQYRFNPVLAAIALVVIVVLRVSFDHSMDLNYRRYDHIFLTTALAIAGIYLFLAISSLLSRSGYIADTLIFIGRGSLFILLFHMPILQKLPLLLRKFVDLNLAWYVLIFLMSVVLPLVAWQVAKRFSVTRMLLLPVLKLPKRP